MSGSCDIITYVLSFLGVAQQHQLHISVGFPNEWCGICKQGWQQNLYTMTGHTHKFRRYTQTHAAQYGKSRSNERAVGNPRRNPEFAAHPQKMLGDKDWDACQQHKLGSKSELCGDPAAKRPAPKPGDALRRTPMPVRLTWPRGATRTCKTRTWTRNS